MNAVFTLVAAVACSATLLLCVAESAVAADPPAAQPPPAPQKPDQQQQPLTFATVQADFDKADYRNCLGKISKLLTTGAYKSDSPERYDLLMLRGECLLRLKQKQGAQAAFESAAKMMRKQEDVQRASSATALVALVKASTPALAYQSKKAGGGDAVDIVEPGSRQKAMGLLMQDLREKVRPDFKKAMNDDSLVPTHNLLRPAWELYSVEMAATGDTALTSERLQELGAHAQKLIGGELKRLNSRLDQLEDLAAEPTWGDFGYGGGGVRGLRTEERNELQGLAKDLVQVEETIHNARRIARLLGRTGENWDAMLAECAVARDSAQRAFDRRY
jgi:hypothetical protein